MSSISTSRAARCEFRRSRIYFANIFIHLLIFACIITAAACIMYLLSVSNEISLAAYLSGHPRHDIAGHLVVILFFVIVEFVLEGPVILSSQFFVFTPGSLIACAFIGTADVFCTIALAGFLPFFHQLLPLTCGLPRLPTRNTLRLRKGPCEVDRIMVAMSYISLWVQWHSV